MPTPATRRHARGATLLVAGALVGLLVVPIGRAPLYWIGVALGLSYLAAALAGGRRGAFWVPGVIVTCWGTAVALVLTGTAHVDFAAAAVTGLGVGALLASGLPALGIPADARGIAAAVTAIGLLELLQAQRHGLFDRGWSYGACLVGWGLWELRPGSRTRRSSRG